ncbi:MAG TPA: polysaccharide biosynthesis/export family protein [Tepidisphaeraceae bacterium]
MRNVLPLLATAALLLQGCANKSASSPQPTQPLATTEPAPAPVAQTSKKNADLNKWLVDVDVVVPPTTYRVDPPDVIQITAPAVKELDKAKTRIRSDGKISLQLVGDLYVAGMSPAEIAQEIATRLGKFYNKESLYVSVEVTEFASKKYYVFGQVSRPGVKSYTGRDTVIKVLAEAALNDDAWPQKVVLVRPNEDPGIRQKVTIDLKEMYANGKTDQNFLLEEGDLVYVPPSPLAEFRIQFTKLMAPITPVADFAVMAFTGF